MTHNVVRCDLCGREIILDGEMKNSEYYRFIKTEARRILPGAGFIDPRDVEMDMCVVCFSKLMRFIRNEKVSF